MKTSVKVNRRNFLKSAAVGVSAAALPAKVPASAGAEVKETSGGAEKTAKPRLAAISGRVRIPGEKNLSGIVVSNGLDCTLTDERGDWRLPTYEGMRFVFVTVPSGYRANWNFIPYPNRNGPKYKYTFWLSKDKLSAVGKPCTFIQITDSETGDFDLEAPWKMRLKRLAAKEDAAFIVHTGDICFRYGILGHFQTINRNTMGRPVYYCLGNHDLEPASRGEETFEAVNGPAWYSFDSRGVHFVVTPMPIGDAKPSYTSDLVAEWIENDLKLVKKGTPVVFFNHMISNWEGKNGVVGFTYGHKRRIRLDKLCNYSGFVYGHTHHNFMRRVGEGGKSVFVCTAPPNKGGIGHDPESFRVLTVEPTGRMRSRLEFGLDDGWKLSSAGAEWETKLRSAVMFSSPIFDNGRIFVGLSDENAEGSGAAVCIDASSGKIIWQADVPGSVFNKMAVAGGKVVAQTKSGEVFAFDKDSGARAWMFEGPRHPYFPVQSGLVADGERVYTGTPSMISALDVKTGRVVWREKNPGYKAGEPSADTPAVGEGSLVFSSNWGGLGAYDAASGKLLWRKTNADDRAFHFPGATPVIDGERILYLGASSLLELDLKTGKIIRRCDLKAGVGVTTRILETRFGLVFGSADKGLVLFDEKAFKVLRTLPAGRSRVTFAPYVSSPKTCVGSAPAAVGETKVAAAATDGAVHVWDLSSGKEVRKFQTGAPYLADAVFDGKRIYAADMAGWIRAFKI